MTYRKNFTEDDEIFEPSAYDYYDYDAMEKLHESRNKKYMKLFKRYFNAKEKGDEAAMKKAVRAMSKHKAQDEKLKEKSQQSGYYWY